MKFKKDTFTLCYMGNLMEAEPAYSDGVLAVYKMGGGWRIGHVASNFNVFSEIYRTKKEAVKVVSKLYEALPRDIWKKTQPFDGLDLADVMFIKNIRSSGELLHKDI